MRRNFPRLTDEPFIRVKITRLEKAFFVVKVIRGKNKGYEKRFKKAEKESFLCYFAPVPPLMFELD